jgi:hypothetical protein
MLQEKGTSLLLSSYIERSTTPLNGVILLCIFDLTSPRIYIVRGTLIVNEYVIVLILVILIEVKMIEFCGILLI